MIHPKSLDNMKKRLENALNYCEIEKGWPVFSFYQDNVFNFSKEVLKNKKEWLTASNVYSIFTREVYSKLKSKFQNEVNINGNLKNLLKGLGA